MPKKFIGDPWFKIYSDLKTVFWLLSFKLILYPLMLPYADFKDVAYT